jgi:phosphoribosylamine--glycine ligase
MSTKILVVGSGGREHVLGWKLARDACAPDLYFAPGNTGTASLGTNIELSADDLDGLAAWASREKPDLTVIGPEAPLCAGIADRFEERGLRIFGPCAAAARLEGSKAFAKEIMESGGVPTARAARFTDLSDAKDYVRSEGVPIVIKADGLAAGKGVTVCDSVEQADAALDAALTEKVFGEAGASVLVEEFMEGEEASILALVDGTNFVLLASSQDHKRALDGDAGPNTGGMGAYSPAPVVTDELWPIIRNDIVLNTIEELSRRGIAFRGVLYAGLMISDSGPRVVEFNVRFGDPEAQCVIPRMKSDLVPVLNACVDGTLHSNMVEWSEESCVCVVMASGGYPGSYRNGDPVRGLSEADRLDGVTVFHAGTAKAGKDIVTAGGRVLGVTALGSGLDAAVRRAYEAAGQITWSDVQYRKDIAGKARVRLHD